MYGQKRFASWVFLCCSFLLSSVIPICLVTACGLGSNQWWKSSLWKFPFPLWCLCRCLLCGWQKEKVSIHTKFSCPDKSSYTNLRFLPELLPTVKEKIVKFYAPSCYLSTFFRDMVRCSPLFEQVVSCLLSSFCCNILRQHVHKKSNIRHYGDPHE
jgi:hypothetical protein